MRVSVTFRNISTSESIKSYAQEKVSKLSRFLINPIDAEVVLEQQGFLNVAEANIRASSRAFTGSESSGDDMYAAIDLMVDKLASQARRYKEKVRDHKATPTSGVVGAKEAQLSRERGSDLDAELDAMGE